MAHALSRLVDPPRLRTTETGGTERRATWFELFFDLVFVVTVAELANALASDPTAGGFLRFAGLFVPVFWVWAGFTFYANRFDTDDLAYRLLGLVAMFAVAALATGIGDAFRGDATTFVLAFVVARVVLVALYARVIRRHEAAQGLAVVYATVFSVGAVLWLASLALPSPWRYVVWGIAIGIELASPVYAWRLVPGAPIDPRHLPERFGLFTIIVLGESILAVVLGVSDTTWELSSALAAAGGFVLAAALWWTYFDFIDASMVQRNNAAGLVFMYAHLPLTLGIASLGAGVKLAVLASGGEGGHEETGWLLGVGVAVCMAAMALIQLATPPTLIDTDVVLRVATAVAALLLVPLSFVVPAAVSLWLLAGLTLLAVCVELLGHETHTAAPGQDGESGGPLGGLVDGDS